MLSVATIHQNQEAGFSTNYEEHDSADVVPSLRCLYFEQHEDKQTMLNVAIFPHHILQTDVMGDCLHGHE